MAFGEYLEQRGYPEEAGFLYQQAGELPLALHAFKKSLNLEMTLSVLSQMKQEDIEKAGVIEELIERLKNASRFEQAGDLIICSLPKDTPKKIEMAMDCFLKANKFLKAYQLIVEQGASEPILMNTVRTHVKIANDVKKNQLLQTLAEFDKKWLRLKIVQHTKKNVPQQLLQVEGRDMSKFDADQLSMSGTSAYSESQFSMNSGSSNRSGISETSKKSKRQGAQKKQQKQKLRKKRNVKEGSPFEEEYLLDSLKEEIKVTAGDKEEVRDIMRALLNFGMVSESTEIHGLIERLMKAQHLCGGLLSVEQERFLEKANSLQLDVIFAFSGMTNSAGLFAKQKRDDDHHKTLAEWRDIKFFKH